MGKRIEPPVELRDGRMLVDIDDAIAALSDARWPQRGERHREALDICLKVKDGHRSIEEARPAIVAAATEAGLTA